LPFVAGANEVINNQFYDYGDNANYEIKAVHLQEG
jgi:hypothetical protein